MVHPEGLEPSRPRGHWPLKPARIPIPPRVGIASTYGCARSVVLNANACEAELRAPIRIAPEGHPNLATGCEILFGGEPGNRTLSGCLQSILSPQIAPHVMARRAGLEPAAYSLQNCCTAVVLPTRLRPQTLFGCQRVSLPSTKNPRREEDPPRALWREEGSPCSSSPRPHRRQPAK